MAGLDNIILDILDDIEDGKPITHEDSKLLKLFLNADNTVNLCGENVRNDREILECLDGLGWNEDEEEDEERF